MRHRKVSFKRTGNGSISGKKAGFRQRASVSVIRLWVVGSAGLSLSQAANNIDQLCSFLVDLRILSLLLKTEAVGASFLTSVDAALIPETSPRVFELL